MALKSDVFKNLVKAGDWKGFPRLVKTKEYDKYSNQLKNIFWDFLCENKRIKEIEDCLRLLHNGYSVDISFSTKDKIRSVLYHDPSALAYAANSKLGLLHDMAISVITNQFSNSDYSCWEKLGGHKIMKSVLEALDPNIGYRYNIYRQNVFNGIIHAKSNGIQIPEMLDSMVLSFVKKNPFEYAVPRSEMPVSCGEFRPRSRNAEQSINHLDYACQEDDPKKLALTISMLDIKAFEYPNMSGFGLVDSMLHRFSFNCLEEALERDPQFLIRPREYQHIFQYDNTPDHNSGRMELHHPVLSWINTLGECDTEDGIKMMRVLYDNFETLLKDKENIPEVAGVKKIVEELETNDQSKLFVFEVKAIFKRAFEKTLAAVNPDIEKYPSVNLPKSPDREFRLSPDR